VLVSDKIFAQFMQGPEEICELFHGYTYSGHPVASAAGLATLQTYQHDQLFDVALNLESYWENAAHALKDSPHVIDVRNIGMLAAIELQPRADTPAARALEVFQKCFDKGVLVRNIGSTIALSPPLIITQEQIDTLFQTIGEVLQSIA
jgi:beta-alanine--pyruvate transaminase